MRFLITVTIMALATFAASERVAFAAVASGASPSTAAPASGNSLAGVQPDCTMVCADIKRKLKDNSKKVAIELERWQQRLGVKGDVVRYDEGFSAAEELLRFMVSHYRLQGIGTQMEPAFLTYMMMKCFPEAHVDPTHARLSKLVDTIWVAKHLAVEKSIATCK